MSIDELAVLGSGTMGAGIAQAALAAGIAVRLYDIERPALERARQRIAAGLERQGQAATLARLSLAETLDELAGVALVIEAAPEQLELKRELLARVALICPAPCVLASNTSSLPIGALAAACAQPQRVAGLHFFNPVHRMALVELVRAAQTDDATVALLEQFAGRIGKTAVQASDTPGFIVNRIARPFYGEALRLLGERVAEPQQIDALLQLAGDFPLGPFALMDMIGIDVNFAVTRSMYEQSFGEPRYRPHLIQQQLVQQGRLGRKSGRGFYDYQGAGAQAEQPPAPIPQTGQVLISSGSWAPGLAQLCLAGGLSVREGLASEELQLRAAWLVSGRRQVAIGKLRGFDRKLAPDLPIFVQCADITAAEYCAQVDHPQRLVGFDGLFHDGAMTLVATPLLDPAVKARAETLVRGLGRLPVWVADAPALVVPRVVAMLANEAAFALGEGVAQSELIDRAMQLGANHPFGPLARAQALGYQRIVQILDHLHAEYGEERYRVAPRLRQAARLGERGVIESGRRSWSEG